MTDLSKHRWVVVADSEMLPVYNGGRKENWGIVTAAAEAGVMRVLVLPHSEEVDVDEYRRLLGVPVLAVPRRMNPIGLALPNEPFVTWSRPAPDDLAARVRALAPDLTGVLCTAEKSARIMEHLATGLGLGAVLRQHNLEVDYHRDLARGTRGPRKLAYAAEARKIRRLERSLDKADWLLAHADISLADARARAGRGARTFYVPTFVRDEDLQTLVRTAAEDPTVVFTGALSVQTNTEAVLWFVTRVWPAVRAAVPRARFTVVGRDPSPAFAARLQVPGVEVHPNVPSVTDYMARAWVGVNPAVIGSGLNIKLIDYLQAGLPVVSTRMASDSLDVRDGEQLLIRDEPADFAAAVVHLLQNPGEGDRLGREGRTFALRMLDPLANITRFAQIMDGDTAGLVTA